MTWKAKAIWLGLSVGVAVLFLVDLCNLLFRCGCQSWWNGAAQLCNIHLAGAPHCPWCSHGWTGFFVPVAAIGAVQAALLFLPGRLSGRSRQILGLAAFPVMGALVGFLFALVSGYPVFLWWRLP